LVVIHHFSFVNAAVNAPRLCKLCKDSLTGTGHGALVYKTPQFLNIPLPKRNKDHFAVVNWFPNWQFKNKGALEHFRGISEDGGPAKFTEKSLRLSI
jgi:hypothetical protein